MATTTGFLYDNEGLYIPKDSEASLTYSLDWTDWLTNGETISSSLFTVETISGDSDPLTKVSQSSTDTVATVKISGGTVGNIYRVYDEITTSGGLTERRYFRIKVETRSL
jgi:hypothetical protein